MSQRPQLIAFLLIACWPLSALGQLPTSSTGQADLPPGTGVIVGQVIDPGTGKGIPGAMVLLSPPRDVGPIMPVAPGSPAAPMQVLATADGRFLFRDLRKGAYALSATKSGYINGAYGSRRPGGGSAPLELDDGEHATGVTIPLWRSAVIAGTVVDEAGEPAVGLEVRALRRSVTAGRRQFVSAATLITDDRGAFRLSGLTPGDYVVAIVNAQTSVPTSVAEAYRDAMQNNDQTRLQFSSMFAELGGMVPMIGSTSAIQVGSHLHSVRALTPPSVTDETRQFAYPTTFHPAVRSVSEATVITLRSGEERAGIDFELRPVRTTRVSGTLLGPDGPAAHVALRLEPGTDDAALEFDASTISDASGGFTFPAVPAGQYTLRVRRIPRSSSAGGQVSVIQTGAGTTITSSSEPAGGPGAITIPDDPTLWTAVPLAVGDAPITGLTVPLHTGSRVRGRLVFDGTADRPEGLQLQRIPILFEPAAGRMDFRSAALVRIEPNGEFASAGVPGGKYFVRVPFAPPGWHFKEARYESLNVADVPVDLDGRDLNGVTIVFTDRPTEVSGTIRSGSGPDADATVLIFPAEDESWQEYGANPRRMRAVRATKLGTYKITGLPAGDYYLAAVPDEQASDWQDPRTLAQLARAASRVTLGDGERKTQDVRTRGR